MFLEPVRSHHEPALFAGRVAPTVLDLVLHGLAVLVDLYCGDDHGMGHRSLAHPQPLLFGHVERVAISRFEVKKLGVHDAFLGVGRLANIAAEEQGSVGLDAGNNSGLKSADGCVDI